MAKAKKQTKQIEPRQTPDTWFQLCSLDIDGDQTQELAKAIGDHILDIEENQSATEDLRLRFHRYYFNRNLDSFKNSLIISKPGSLTEENMTYNICKMAPDALLSKIAKNKVRAFFLTSEGDIDQQERAQMITAFMDHMFDRERVDLKKSIMYREKLIGGTGALFVDIGPDGMPMVENVPMSELRIDENQPLDRNGNPTNLHRVRLLPRWYVRNKYPDLADLINAAPPAHEDRFASSRLRNRADTVRLVESWHLETVPRSNDGWKVVSIQGFDVLTIERFTMSRLPGFFSRWTPPAPGMGFLGAGLVEELVGIQNAINEVLQRAFESARFSVPRVFIDSTTSIDEAELNDVVGAIVRYNGGTPPVFSTSTSIAPELFQLLSMSFEKGFEVTGVSMMSATSRKPAGVESQVALAQLDDKETERFSQEALDWERISLDIAEYILELCINSFSKRTKIKLRTSDGRFLEQTEWQKMELPRDSVELSIYPTPILPKTPAGQTEAVISLAQYGVTTPEETKTLLRFPDADAAKRRASATHRYCLKVVNDILKTGEVAEQPNAYMPLELMASVALDAWRDSYANESIPDKNREALQSFMDALADQATPAPDESMQDASMQMPDPNAASMAPQLPSGPMPQPTPASPGPTIMTPQ